MVENASIRTFNSAKKFAEEVLHPLIVSHNNAKIRSRLGGVSDEEAIQMSPQLRVIKRFNAMKERIIYQQSLITEVEPTVRLNGRKAEIEMIEELTKQLSLMEDSYDERSDELIVQVDKVPQLTQLFKTMGQYLDKTYVILQSIMTKNKLLFFGGDNEFMENEQLMERIKAENRKA